ncbi:MAG: hypothetical protein FWE46_03900 [Coriobacteriia bacterium]|nr:hypothetical protein [Coriobacteriia bacterium]MCL2537770.1 hypothetical protein [Coriobacteriia bacterium]
MQSSRNTQSGVASRSRARHNYKVSRYSDSYHWPGHSELKPRTVSSSHLSKANRGHREFIDNFSPYERLNYGGGSHRAGSDIKNLHLSGSSARAHQLSRIMSQRVTLGIAALFIALTGAGMIWMNYSHAQAQASELLTTSYQEYQTPAD